MARKPFRLDGAGIQPGSPRDVLGRFARPDATPANPLAEKKPASNDQQTMSGWAPGIGKGTAQTTGPTNPYQPITREASSKSGFNVS